MSRINLTRDSVLWKRTIRIDKEAAFIKLFLILLSAWITVLYSLNETMFEVALPAALLLFVFAQIKLLTSKK